MIRYILFRIARRLVWLFPVRISYRMADMISAICYMIKKRERGNIVSNLKIVSRYIHKGYNQDELENLAKMVFINFGRYLVDFLRVPEMERDEVIRLVDISGLEYLNEALSKNRGIIGLTAHIGNWELCGYIASILGYPVYGIVLPYKNVLLERFFYHHRRLAGVKSIPVGSSGFRYTEVLRNGGIIAVVGDRSTTDAGMEMEFFGKKTMVPRGPIVLSIRTGAPVVPGFILKKDNRFNFSFEKPIYPEEFKEGGKINREKFGRRVLEIIEKYISIAPEQWFVFQKIWH